MELFANLYHAEITDTFGGEANYCWKRDYWIKANTERGAINKLAKHYGAGWVKDYEGRYNLKGAAICCFIDCLDDEEMVGIDEDKII